MLRRFISSPQFLGGIGVLAIEFIFFFGQGGFVKMPLWQSILYVIGIIFATFLIFWAVWKEIHRLKGLAAISASEKRYMANINGELQNINEYYIALVDSVNIKEIKNRKIRMMDDNLRKVLGLITIKPVEHPHIGIIIKVLLFLLIDIFLLGFIYARARMSKKYVFRLFREIGDLPDATGIGLKLHDTKKAELSSKLLRLIGERISSNETVNVIFMYRDLCYSVNNIYLWVRMYPKAHKKSRLNLELIIKTLYESREKMMAYASAEVNKALIKEFSGS